MIGIIRKNYGDKVWIQRNEDDSDERWFVFASSGVYQGPMPMMDAVTMALAWQQQMRKTKR